MRTVDGEQGREEEWGEGRGCAGGERDGGWFCEETVCVGALAPPWVEETEWENGAGCDSRERGNLGGLKRGRGGEGNISCVA